MFIVYYHNKSIVIVISINVIFNLIAFIALYLIVVNLIVSLVYFSYCLLMIVFHFFFIAIVIKMNKLMYEYNCLY